MEVFKYLELIRHNWQKKIDLEQMIQIKSFLDIFVLI